jgi:hypothetical protein
VRRHEGRRGRRQRVCHPSALRDRLHSTISGILAQGISTTAGNRR